MTEKLYYTDSFQREFTAQVTGCEPAGDCWRVTLDRTAFYPEGGGQPADTGILGGVRVLDVHERDGEVVHTADAPLAVGEMVAGTIELETRFSRMQHHTGEHIISGLIHRLYGLDNVGFHMGRDAVTLDLSGPLTAEQLANVERLANEAVWRDLPVEACWPDAHALAALDYRSKKELSGAVRIVTVPGYDACACCGTHLKTTGQIGVIKLLTAQSYKGGTRIWMLCGDRALQDYAAKNAQAHAIGALLSVKALESQEAVERLYAEQEALKQKCAALKTELYRYRAQEAEEDATYALLFEEEMSPAELRGLCLALIERVNVAGVFARDGENTWKYALGSKRQDIRPLGKELNAAFSGRGGGAVELVQGSLAGGREEIDAFFGERV